MTVPNTSPAPGIPAVQCWISMAIARIPETDGTGKAVAAAADPPGGDTLDQSSWIQRAMASAPVPLWALLIALALLTAGLIASWLVYVGVAPNDFTPSSNYTAFAGLFVAALAIERLLEPFSGYFAPSLEQTEQLRDEHLANALTAAAVPDAATVAPGLTPQTYWAKEAANAQQRVNQLRAVRAVFAWAVASVLAMLMAAVFGFFLLRSLEQPQPSSTEANAPAVTDRKSGAKDPNRALDLLLTGLVVGAGTKPLHDLVSQIQTSKNNAKDPNATGTNAT
jgi:hypothetical protein